MHFYVLCDYVSLGCHDGAIYFYQWKLTSSLQSGLMACCAVHKVKDSNLWNNISREEYIIFSILEK